jgi:glycosyltransferase involved in cell wall biosynthesis
MPYYNNAAYIEAAVQSYLVQTEEDIEIILYGDGSTDKSGDLVRQCSDRRIVHKESCANQGISAAYNAALELARSDCVIFAGADDLAEKDRVAESLSLFAGLSDAPAILASKIAIIDEHGKPTGVTYGFPDYVNEGNVLLETLKRNYFLGAAMAFSHVSALRLDESLPAGDDFDLALRLLISGAQWIYSPKPLVRYRVHSSNFSLDHRRMMHGAQAVLRKHDEIELREILARLENKAEEIEIALGIAQLFLDNIDRATELLDQANPRESTAGRLLFEREFYRGVVRYRKGKLNESLSYFAAAAQISPTDVATMNNVAVLNILLDRDRPGAEALLDAALAKQPSYLDARANREALRQCPMGSLKVTQRILPSSLLLGDAYRLEMPPLA